jgi:hypothetical protein
MSNDLTIKIRLDIEENDPLFEKFNAIKEKTGISANTEVIRYALKKAFDIEFIKKKKLKLKRLESKLAKKKKREVVHIACLQKEFVKMKKYLDSDEEPVFLTFLNVTGYKDSKDMSRVMIKTAIEKAEG